MHQTEISIMIVCFYIQNIIIFRCYYYKWKDIFWDVAKKPKWTFWPKNHFWFYEWPFLATRKMGCSNTPNTFLSVLLLGPDVVDFNMFILDLLGVSYFTQGVFFLGTNFLFKSILAYCDIFYQLSKSVIDDNF